MLSFSVMVYLYIIYQIEIIVLYGWVLFYLVVL